MDKKIRKKIKSGFSLVELLCVLVLMTILTALISLGMRFSTTEFRNSVRNAEAGTLASSINTLITEELSYATDIQVYILPSDDAVEDYLGLQKNAKVFVYSSMTQGDYTFLACTNSNLSSAKAESFNKYLGQGRVYLYTGYYGNEGLDFKAGSLTINAMVPAKNYSEGCYIRDFEITAIKDGAVINLDNLTYEQGLSKKIDVDYFNVSYNICYLSNGVEKTILSEVFQVKCLQQLTQLTTGDYQIEYHSNNSFEESTFQDCTYGADVILQGDAVFKNAYEGYTFLGWSIYKGNDAIVTYKEGATVKNLLRQAGGVYHLYAVWKDNDSVTIAFNTNGGSPISSITAKAGVDIRDSKPTDPKKTGYTFNGWDQGGFPSKMPTQNITLNAQWEALKYTVKFDGNGATSGTMADQEFTYDVAQKLTDNDFAKSGYSFDGWSTVKNGAIAHEDGAEVKNLTTTINDTIILYAKWTAGSYTVKFNGNGNTGGSMSDQKITYDVDAKLSSNGFTKTGYTFAGWNTKSDGTGTSYTNGASVKNVATSGTVTLFAQWTPITYKVRFYGNNHTGGSMDEQTITYDVSTALTQNGFTRNGYVFMGWATSATGSVAYANGASVINLKDKSGETFNLYAVWANGYSVRFDKNGATTGTMVDQSFVYGTAQKLTKNTYQKTGYTFNGWKDSSGKTYTDEQSVNNLTNTAGGIFVMTAQWTANTYSVKFDGNGATSGSMSNESMTYDSSKALTSNGYSKTGYTFAGWATSANGSVVYGNGVSVKNLTSAANGTFTLYAKWTANTYSIKFDGNGATSGSMDNESMTYDSSKALTSNGYSRTGYTFAGWATSASGSVVYGNGASVTNLTSTAGGTFTLYAKWTAGSYTVKFNGNGNTGGSMSDQTITYDVSTALTANGFEKTGYTFAGWAESSTGNIAYGNKASVKNLLVSGTKNLYAKWAANTYYVKFDGNGATSGSMDNESMTYDASKALTANGYKKTGYTFAGWATSANGSVVYGDGASVTNLTSTAGGTFTLYAKWTPGKYTVKFYNKDGTSLLGEQQITYGSGAQLKSISNNVRAGYTFAGWATTANGSKVYDANGVPNDPTTSEQLNLYAAWNPITYTIKFDGNGSTYYNGLWHKVYEKDYRFSDSSSDILSNQFTVPNKTSFKGWNTKADGSGTDITNISQLQNYLGSLTNLNGEIRLYAKWRGSLVTITFVDRHDSNNKETFQYVYGETVKLPKVSITRSGKTVKGYGTTKGSDAVSFEIGLDITLDSRFDENRTLYVKWK